MANILETIVETKKKEIILAKEKFSLKSLEEAIIGLRYYKRSLSNNLIIAPGIIAEFKRASPSKGVIHENASAIEIITGYDQYGASGISVLTDRDYFQAKPEDFKKARACTDKPILRKEFIIDEYQVYESKIMGADAILLIAAILTKSEIQHLTELAHSLGLEVLLELHNEDELDKMCGSEDMIGVNNRDLKTFNVDINQSIRIRKLLGNPGMPMLSESGLSSINEIETLLKEGFKGFLMGEYFMKQSNTVDAFQRFKEKFDLIK